jgi:hypothetical protein
VVAIGDTWQFDGPDGTSGISRHGVES